MAFSSTAWSTSMTFSPPAASVPRRGGMVKVGRGGRRIVPGRDGKMSGARVGLGDVAAVMAAGENSHALCSFIGGSVLAEALAVSRIYLFGARRPAVTVLLKGAHDLQLIGGRQPRNQDDHHIAQRVKRGDEVVVVRARFEVLDARVNDRLGHGRDFALHVVSRFR
jgi:hypothetical protein